MRNVGFFNLKMPYFIGILVLLLGVGVFCFGQGVPSFIDPNRVRPQANITIPSVSADPDFVDYFFEPGIYESKPGKEYRLVHARIPKRSFFLSRPTDGPIRSYSITLKMFYPDFSGLADPENAECRTDEKEATGNKGYCRGEVNVQFGYAHDKEKNEMVALRKLDSDIKSGYIKAKNGSSLFPGLELAGIEVASPSVGSANHVETFYVSRNKDGDREYVIGCRESVISPSCDVTFRASKSPNIFICVDFNMALLGQWKGVIEGSRNKVDSMIFETYKLTPKE